MDTMISKISLSNNIIFESQNQHVRCLAHIINLAAKCLLEGLNASGLDVSEEIFELENDKEKLQNSIYKVIFNCYKNLFYIKLLIINFIFFIFS
jgi:hypothetical protein